MIYELSDKQAQHNVLHFDHNSDSLTSQVFFTQCGEPCQTGPCNNNDANCSL